MNNPSTCLNCGVQLQGTFCSACGQKQVDPSERSVVYFLKQFFGAAFFLENSFLKNLWKLLTKPGLQALDYVEGRKKRWMPPFSLFLLINLFFFLIESTSDFSQSLMEQATFQTYSPMVNRMVDERLEERKISYSEYEALYNNQSVGLAKSFIILNVPISALLLYIILFKRRRYFSDHFVHVLYQYSFLLLFSIFVYLTFTYVPGFDNRVVQNLSLLMPLIVYTFLSTKRFYQLGIWKAILVTLFTLAAIVVSNLIYRFFLFLITFWTT